MICRAASDAARFLNATDTIAAAGGTRGQADISGQKIDGQKEDAFGAGAHARQA
jgi:hypothetical protein